MSEPKISIIINSYNYEDYIGQTIESAVYQDYPNKEIIVVDDGSTDKSKGIILSFGDKIIPLFHENLGQARTCLLAAQSATGDFIYFLDSDDYLLPGGLAAVAAACTPDVAKVQFQLLPVGPQGEAVGEAWPVMSDASRDELIDLIGRCGTYATPPTSGNVYRADVLRYIDDIDYEGSIDGIPYLLAPLLGEVRQIAEPLGCYRYHSQNFSGHGRLDAARFRLESRRHIARLAHLQDIARDNGLSAPAISAAEDHSYVHTRNMIVDISEGKRPGVRQCYRYVKSIIREEKSLDRIVRLAVWGVAATLGSDSLRRRLAIYRSDPRSRKSASRRAVAKMDERRPRDTEFALKSQRDRKKGYPGTKRVIAE